MTLFLDELTEMIENHIRILANETKSSCEEGRFRCNNGNCIPNRWRCDQENDCADGSDEIPSMCINYCKHHEIKCRNGEQCIPVSWKCDGSPDCRDKSDEENCLYKDFFFTPAFAEFLENKKNI
uniref:Uncharacterized protein n=1 Tax=Glossina brevipalpis TaxID=37001 RepID=A0A1A9WSW6_9MUSC